MVLEFEAKIRPPKLLKRDWLMIPSDIHTYDFPLERIGVVPMAKLTCSLCGRNIQPARPKQALK